MLGLMDNIQIRIDEATKKAAKTVLDTLGIDMSSAIKVYLKQIVIHQGIPFKLVTENGLTPDEEQAILKASREAASGKNITKSMTPKEALNYLKKL